MAMDAAHTKWWQIFEVVFGIPLLIAILLQRFLPLSFPRGSFTIVILLAGVISIFLGIRLISLARREFARHNQPTDPNRSTQKMITTGVFSFSRNPLYLGGVCFIVGIGFTFNLPWVLILLPPALVACHFILILPEERYLAAKFGAEYRSYAASVQRWIGKIKSPPTE